jgi:hypothetical protein
MGKCNLFAPISQETGNFLLFSQYTEDLTRSTGSEDYYRVVPSRYVLLNLNPKSGWGEVEYSEYFQNYYENACAAMRSNNSVGWKPDCAESMLWKALYKVGLINPPTEGAQVSTSSSVVYCGHIDITSDKEFDGIHYTETYISVPQGAARQKFEFTRYSPEMTRVVQWPENYIVGYPDDEYPTAGTERWPRNRINVSSEYSDGTVEVEGHTEYVYELRGPRDYNLVTEPIETLEDESYKFNCIVVLYDIYKRGAEEVTDTVVYENIPMGIYFTGTPDSAGLIQNPVTIWVENEDIYRQGTSYGFRICTRYLSTQNQLFIVDSTIEDAKELYDQYATVMSKIGDSQVKMDQIVQRMSSYQNNITEHLANVKNYKVNVPYIRNIGGVNYWFVNGKNLGVTTTETTLVWEKY